MRYDAEILNEFRQIIDALRQKKMTRQEALRQLREIGSEIEVDQWQIIEDLRTRAPENQRESARELTDLLAAELGKEEETPSPPPAAPPLVRWAASLKSRALNIAAIVKFMMLGGEG